MTKSNALFHSKLFAAHTELILTVVLAFVMRYYLSGWRSYWFDELLSVVVYGSDQSSSVEAIISLANNSIHPPLYQFILYQWMLCFGDSEVATRSLSNLYVAGATICLYMAAYRAYNCRVAIVSAICFSFMYIPIYYALETRSYAQTIFLSTLSSLLFFSVTQQLPHLRAKELFSMKSYYGLTVANFALLMTHYFNVFFFGAQALFLTLYLLLRSKPTSFKALSAKIFCITGPPAILFAAIWAPVVIQSWSRYLNKGAYVVDMPSASPLGILFNLVIDPNFKGSRLALVLVMVGLTGLMRRILVKLFRRRHLRVGVLLDRDFFTIYLIIWLFIPCVIAYLLFLVAGSERYADRYFVFCTPPLAILIVLAIDELIRLGTLVIPSSARRRIYRRYLGFATGYMLAFIVVFIVPQGHRAASAVKEDYRGIATAVTNAIRGDGDHRYILYEASYRPTLNFYLSKIDRNIRVHGTLTREIEAEGDRFEDPQAEMAKYDYLILAFTHHRESDFPQTLKRLAKTYTLEMRQFDSRGRGFVVYRVRPPQAAD